MIGNATGLESWQQSGREEHAQGEAEYKAAQAKGYAEGTIDRMGGKKDAVVGALTGDRQQEASGKSSGSRDHERAADEVVAGNIRHDKGEAQQNINDPTS